MELRAVPTFTPVLHCALQKNLDGGRVLLSSSHIGLLEAIVGLLKGLLQGCLLTSIRSIRNRTRTLAIAGVAVIVEAPLPKTRVCHGEVLRPERAW